MSFCNQNQPTEKCPGNINGNPLNGLCEKVCIQAKKVFDACIYQSSLENLLIKLTSTTPANPTLPLTYVSGKSTSSTGTISNLTITPLTDKQGLSRVQCTVSIPVQIKYTDAKNVSGVGVGTVEIPRDIIMCVPTGSVISPQIASTVNIAFAKGAYVSELTFTTTACVTVIMKVEAEVELLIPSYGYCKLPPCTEFNQEVCEGVFDLPLFPN